MTRLLCAISGLVLALAAMAATAPALPKIGPAPEFSLVDQSGKPFKLADQRGKVAVVTFIFTRCADTCPALTAKLVSVQRRLARQAKQVTFAAITVDPNNDTPEVLKKYAAAHTARLENFSFLTGTLAQVEDVSRRFAVYRKQQQDGAIEHAFLTSIIDGQGTLRVQYLGSRFSPVEFEADIHSLLKERKP